VPFLAAEAIPYFRSGMVFSRVLFRSNRILWEAYRK
jgi:hypothetical protein